MARTSVGFLWLAALLVLPLSGAAAQQADEAPLSAEMTEADAGFVPPQIILGTQKQPVYPPAAWDARYTGSVLLEMTVMEDGSVGEVKVVKCNRPKLGFEDAATAAVKAWRFEPGLENGVPVEVTTRLKLNFTRVGAGVRAEPRVSAGSFSVAERGLSSNRSATSASTSGAGPK